VPATCARANRGFFREIGIVDQTESSTLSDPVRPVTRRVPDISTLKTYPRAIASDGDLSSLLASYGFRDLSLKIHPRRAAPRRRRSSIRSPLAPAAAAVAFRRMIYRIQRERKSGSRLIRCCVKIFHPPVELHARSPSRAGTSSPPRRARRSVFPPFRPFFRDSRGDPCSQGKRTGTRRSVEQIALRGNVKGATMRNAEMVQLTSILTPVMGCVCLLTSARAMYL